MTDKLVQLQQLMAKLLDSEQGCRWLKEQSFATIAPYTIEEAFELVEAIERNDSHAMRDELADQLYHLLIYSELGRRAGLFDFNDIINTVFAKQQTRRNLENLEIFASAEQAHADWRERKRQEKLAANPEASVLDDIPVSMPALVRSKKIQDRAGHLGFDWNNVGEVLEKLAEEVAELEVEIAEQRHAAMRDELGDILFTCVNVGRHLGVDPEQALREANNKFEKRFRYIEQQLLKRNLAMRDLAFAQLLEIWAEAKRNT